MSHRGTSIEAIANSLTVSEWFADAVKPTDKQDMIAGGARNVGMAKHRFASVSKRLGRFVGKFVAVLEVARKIRVARAGRGEAA
eukprot:7769497-Alexandrium_andersonii.AAC.1